MRKQVPPCVLVGLGRGQQFGRTEGVNHTAECLKPVKKIELFKCTDVENVK